MSGRRLKTRWKDSVIQDMWSIGVKQEEMNSDVEKSNASIW